MYLLLTYACHFAQNFVNDWINNSGVPTTTPIDRDSQYESSVYPIYGGLMEFVLHLSTLK